MCGRILPSFAGPRLLNPVKFPSFPEEPTSKIFFAIFFIGSCLSLSGQESLTWFNASSLDSYEISVQSTDCTLKEDKLTGAGNYSQEFESMPLFVYTHPQIRQYLDKKFLIEASGYITKVDKNLFLLIDYKINSSQAKTNYGNLQKGSKIKVSLLGNDHIYLENIERDRGTVRKKSNYTTYTGTYAITKESANALKKNSIDKITILWEEGVEQYEIQNIDMIKNQLNCLND